MEVLLKIDGFFKDFKVAELDFSFDQATSVGGRPRARGLLSPIIIVYYPECFDDESRASYRSDMLMWMVSLSEPRDGEIVFYNSGSSNEILKTIRLKGAYCTNYKENYRAVSAERITHKITLTVTTFEEEGAGNTVVTYSNLWDT